MDGTSKKFDQIVVLFPRFSGKNQENLIRTAKSLLTIQTKNALLTGQSAASSPETGARTPVNSPAGARAVRAE